MLRETRTLGETFEFRMRRGAHVHEGARRVLVSGWPVAGALAVLLVVFVHTGTLRGVKESSDDELPTIARVRDYIVNEWVEDPGPRRERLRYGAVGCMAGQLDPDSEFIPPERKDRVDEETEGTLRGL